MFAPLTTPRSGPPTPLAAAPVAALAGCPNDAAWDAVGWNDLYGE